MKPRSRSYFKGHLRNKAVAIAVGVAISGCAGAYHQYHQGAALDGFGGLSRIQGKVSGRSKQAPSKLGIIRVNYEGFTVWVDCAKRGPIKFQYVAQRDSGNNKRYDKFFIDKDVPAECQQFTSKAYGHGYDRGHQVPANHLDYSEKAIRSTNSMTNILPQAANMNRGAWLLTEEIVECYRDIDDLLVIGGVIWGNNKDDDYFIQSHGVRTPDAFWKVIIKGAGEDERAISWIVPNSQDATRDNLDSYLVSVEDIEKATGEKIPVAEYSKYDAEPASWMIPIGCNKG